MDEALLTLAFLALATIGIFLRLVLPLVLIVMGIIRIRKNNESGKVLLIVGSVYLLISMALFVYSGVKYGL